MSQKGINIILSLCIIGQLIPDKTNVKGVNTPDEILKQQNSHFIALILLFIAVCNVV